MFRELAGLLIVFAVSLLSVKSSALWRRTCRKKTCSLFTLDTDATFSYDNGQCDGPGGWRDLATCWTTCDNTFNFRQSPINIRFNVASYRPYPLLNFKGTACRRVFGIIRKTGQSPEFVAVSRSIVLTGVPLGSWFDTYVFREFHFHIGKNQLRGSEHSISGRFSPMEIHMVFWKRRYGTIEIAKSAINGLVVVAVFVEVASQGDTKDSEGIMEFKEMSHNVTNSDTQMGCNCAVGDENCQKECECDYDYNCDGSKICVSDNQNPRRRYCDEPGTCTVRYARDLSYLMEKYFSRIATVKRERAFDIEEGISIGDALPYDQHYYSYRGSLTTPPCSETVRWIVMRCPIKVSLNAYVQLQRVQNVYGNQLGKHGVRRPIQRGGFGQTRVGVIRNFRLSEVENNDIC